MKKKYKKGKPSSELDTSIPEERKLLRKRLVSNAWRKQYDLEIARGSTESIAKGAASAFALQAGAKFDQEHPRPEAPNPKKSKKDKKGGRSGSKAPMTRPARREEMESRNDGDGEEHGEEPGRVPEDID